MGATDVGLLQEVTDLLSRVTVVGDIEGIDAPGVAGRGRTRGGGGVEGQYAISVADEVDGRESDYLEQPLGDEDWEQLLVVIDNRCVYRSPEVANPDSLLVA